MISHLSPKFRKAYQQLPPEIRAEARAGFRAWIKDHYASRFEFKRMESLGPDFYSVRVNYRYRALNRFASKDTIVWFWIGVHARYDYLT